MNCDVTILKTFNLETRGEFVCKVKQGDVYAGTTREPNGVIFHVTDPTGTIHPVYLDVNDQNIKIQPYDNEKNTPLTLNDCGFVLNLAKPNTPISNSR